VFRQFFLFCESQLIANGKNNSLAERRDSALNPGFAVEQEIADSCKRLIITCWNYLYLSQRLGGTDNLDSLKAGAKFSVVSSVGQRRMLPARALRNGRLTCKACYFADRTL
jgi:hypothetical protein